MSGHHKHLHELLSQDQDPFLLHDYLLHRLRQLHPSTSPAPPLVPLSRPKTRHLPFPSHYNFSLKRLRFVPSHDPANSPSFEFPSAVAPPRSPCHRAAVSLLVPARTAALLLEAASRIQRSGSVRLPRKQSFGSRIMGLVTKRFARRKSKSASLGQNGNEPSCVESPSGGCNHGVVSDVEGNGTLCDEHSRNSLLPVETQECSCPEERSPEFPSPPASPKHAGEGNEGRCGDTCKASKGKNVDEEEDERQQFSPVSVLDPPFEVEVDDEDGGSPVVNCEEGDRNRVDAGFDYECSLAFVQRTKQQLLDKLQRFERLARLDPVELEKRMLESDDEEVETEHEDRLTVSFTGLRKSPDGISKLILDLVAEEERDSESRDRENGGLVVVRVSKRLESWEEGSHTIDTIVNGELKARWEPGEEQFGLLAGEIEFGMLESLLEELTAENLSC